MQRVEGEGEGLFWKKGDKVMKSAVKTVEEDRHLKELKLQKGNLFKDTVKTVEDFFVRNRTRFVYIHIGMFMIFALLILVPTFLPFPAEDARILNNFTLFARFLIWGLWFPLVLLSVIFFGRLWCGLLCPHGALSEYASKKGLNRPIPKWLRWGGVPILSFIFITILGQLVGVREYPMAALEVLGGTMVIAVIVGFLYADGKRPFCRYLCPMGPLLGIFSRLGAVSFEKDVRDGRGYACPTFINTAKKVSSSNCIACFKCVNSGIPGSLHLRIRRPGLEIEEIKKREPNLWEVVFLISAAGLALSAFHWQVNPLYIQYKQAIGRFLLNLGLGNLIGWGGPWWIMVNYPETGDVFNLVDFISVISFMLVIMAGTAIILLLLTTLSALILKNKDPLIVTITRLGYLYAPVALVSLVIGLGLILFQSLSIFGGTFGLSKVAIQMIQGIFFAGGGIWSLYLAIRLQGGIGLATIPNAFGIGLVAMAWYKVLF